MRGGVEEKNLPTAESSGGKKTKLSAKLYVFIKPCTLMGGVRSARGGS